MHRPPRIGSRAFLAVAGVALVAAACARDDADAPAASAATAATSVEAPTTSAGTTPPEPTVATDASAPSETSAAADTSGPPADSSGLDVVEDGLDEAITAELDSAAEAAFAGVSAPGAVMAVRTPEGTWVTTIGTKDLAGTVPMTADVHQRVGSITKTFTVTALLQLVDQGLVSLDDPISRYVAGTPNPDATLRELGTMRSGIPSYTFDEAFQDQLFADPDTVWTPEQLVDIVRDAEPEFAPGEAMSYSNTNLILLGLVIEQVAGKPIDEVIREQIVEPLGLRSTVFPRDGSLSEPHASGYTLQGQDDAVPADATEWNPSWAWTAGAIISDVHDLLTYGDELVAGDVLLSPGLQADRIDSFDFTIPPNSPERAYGLGLTLFNGWYGHTGELPGFNTTMQHHLDEDITLVVMVNSDIQSGDCPDGSLTVPGGRTDGPCQDPATYIADALSTALGFPLHAVVPAAEDATDPVGPSDTAAATTTG